MTIAFYAVAEHHALATRPIYQKMKKTKKDVTAIFNQPFKNASEYNRIVSSTAPDVAPEKRKNTIYHFHSLSPYHANPNEEDYKYIPLFKAVMFPGEWWVTKWKKLPKHWAVVGWPKTDLLPRGSKPHRDPKTVLYASSMFNFHSMKTLRLLLDLSKKMGFNLIVKPHHGTAIWFPKLLTAMISEAKNKEAKMVKSTVDVATLFPLADVLVSEASGALWEFMATGNPSIQMEQGEKWGRTYPGGVLKANFNNLGKILQKCVDNPDVTRYSGWCEKVMGKVDGKATLRAIKLIEEMFNE